MVEYIWRTYHKQLLSFIRKRVTDNSLADDILQEVFIKIHTRIDSLQDKRKIKAWLFQLTRNTILDFYRKVNLFDDVPFELMDWKDENDSFALQDIKTCIVPMIKSLPDDYRDALFMTELNGWSQKEMAKKMQISYSAAKSRVQRGRSLLKEALSKCCSFEHDSKGRLIDYEKKMPTCDNCKGSNVSY